MANTHSIQLVRASSQYLSIASASQTGLAFSSNFTLEAWIKPDSAADTYPLVSRYANAGAGVGYTMQMLTTKNIRTAFSASDGTGAQVATSGAPIANVDGSTWYHVAVTWDISTKTAVIYINGSSVSLGAYDFQNGTAIDTGARTFDVGRFSDDIRYFDGKIDEVRVWTVIRTATEIANNYQVELVGNESNLVAYYNLNNALTDSTANANNLTNNGSATFSTNTPFGAVTARKVLMMTGVGG